jgi:hypothetical protein
MIVTLKNEIKGILESIVDESGTRKIVVVYTYPESKPTGYPYAILTYKGDESEELTNSQERVTYEFEIALIQDKIENLKGRENAETTTMEMSYEISSAFRESDDLGLASVLRVRPIKTEKEYVENSTRINLRTTLQVETIENINT